MVYRDLPTETAMEAFTKITPTVQPQPEAEKAPIKRKMIKAIVKK